MSNSCVTHLTILHAHGLTPALLERFASFVEQGKSGSFIFHTQGGNILAYEEHHRGRVEVLERLAAMEDIRDGHRKRSL